MTSNGIDGFIESLTHDFKSSVKVHQISMCLVHSQECIQEINKKLMLTLEFDYKIHAGIRGFLTLESLTLIKGLSDKSSYIRSVYSQ